MGIYFANIYCAQAKRYSCVSKVLADNLSRAVGPSLALLDFPNRGKLGVRSSSTRLDL